MKLKTYLVVGAIALLANCGDLYRSFSGQATDGSLVAADISMAGVNSVVSGNVASKEDQISIRIQSTLGWNCNIDYEHNLSSIPDNAFPMKCSNGATGLIMPHTDGRRGFTFGLSNGVTGSVSDE